MLYGLVGGDERSFVGKTAKQTFLTLAFLFTNSPHYLRTQVNGWGFKRITHGSDYNSYYRKSYLVGCFVVRSLAFAMVASAWFVGLRWVLAAG